MSTWQAVGAADEIPLGSAREVVVGDRVVAIFHTEEGFFALDGVCPHNGGPLGKGTLGGCTVTCPWHGWQFDVRSGQHGLSRTVRQPSFPVRVEAGQLYVDVASETTDDG